MGSSPWPSRNDTRPSVWLCGLVSGLFVAAIRHLCAFCPAAGKLALPTHLSWSEQDSSQTQRGKAPARSVLLTERNLPRNGIKYTLAGGDGVNFFSFILMPWLSRPQ